LLSILDLLAADDTLIQHSTVHGIVLGKNLPEGTFAGLNLDGVTIAKARPQGHSVGVEP
jgi:hypothetical protein